MTGEQLQAELAALTRRYEAHAYVAWGVALRATLADDAARRAVIGAFLAGDGDVVAAVGATALAESAAAPTPEDSWPEPLRGTAALRPPERVALALVVLAGVPADAVPRLLGQAADADLVERAWRSLGEATDRGPEDIDAAYRALPWPEPPADLWPVIHARALAAGRGRMVAAGTTAAGDAGGWRGRGRRRRLLGAALLVLLAGAAAAIATADDRRPAAGAAVLAAPAGGPAAARLEATPTESEELAAASATPASGARVRRRPPRAGALTPGELDELRGRELQRVRALVRRQGDRSAAPDARRRAAGELARLRRLARTRLRQAAVRERRLREALARERRRRERTEAERDRAAARERRSPSRRPPASADGAPARTAPREAPAVQENPDCLLNEADGSYVCPQ